MSQNIQTQPARTITTREAVAIIRQETGLYYQDTTVAQWLRQKKIKAKKFGKQWVIDEQSFRDFIKARLS